VLTAVLIISAFIETLGIGMILPLMEVCVRGEGDPGKYTRSFADFFSWIPGDYLIHVLWVAIVLIMFLRSGSLLLKRYLIFRFAADLKKFWSRKIMTNMIHYRFKEITRFQKGVLVTNLRVAPNKAAKCLRSITEAFAKAVLAVFTFCFMLAVSWKVSLAALGVGIILSILQWKVSKKYSMDVGYENIRQNQKIKSFVVECFQGIRQVKNFGMEKPIIETYVRHVKRFEDLMLRFNVASILPRVSGEFIIALGLVSIILGYTYVMKESMVALIPLLSVMLLCFQRLYFNLGEILTLRIKILAELPALKLVNELTFSKRHTEERHKGDRIEAIDRKVAFEDISFAYEGKPPLFDRLNLEFSKNCITAVVGPSGCGKTTVCDLVSGFYSPGGGCIRVDDRTLGDIHIHTWRGLIGHVSQDTFLFNLSVRENILCGKSDGTPEEVTEAAKQAGADEFIRAMPEGYDTLIGEDGLGLSGGQCQRIAIARALIRRPEILIFDEATSALDSENERVILKTIRELKNGRIIIFVSHRIPVLSIADNIYVLDRGRLAETGTYGELLERRGMLWRLQHSLGEER
jgi:ABC-type bacteriocin/lantibiotic exporter with double-glycine peptidase domain